MAKLTFEQFQKKVQNFAKNNPKIVTEALADGAEMLRGHAVEAHLTGPTGPHSLSVDSNNLRTSLTTRVEATAAQQKATVGTNVIYAAIHEYGGTITAKNAPYLHFKGSRGWAKVKSVKIPARRWLGTSLDEKRKDIVNLILRVLIQGFRRAL